MRSRFPLWVWSFIEVSIPGFSFHLARFQSKTGIKKSHKSKIACEKVKIAFQNSYIVLIKLTLTTGISPQ
jgi:hypothetical protein